MAAKFEAFMPYQQLFDANVDYIINVWLTDEDLLEVLDRHEITVEQFAEEFAREVVQYFLSVAGEKAEIGDCL